MRFLPNIYLIAILQCCRINAILKIAEGSDEEDDIKPIKEEELI